MLWQIWWVWMVGALALGVAEMLAPAFVLLGFGLGAAVVGLGLLSGVLTSASLAALMALWAVLSLLAWVGLRYAFRKPNDAPKTFDYDIND